ncbi:hypothetical protein LINPERHAP2_LOCUS4827 [Linum perenne]
MTLQFYGVMLNDIEHREFSKLRICKRRTFVSCIGYSLESIIRDVLLRLA